MNEVWWQTFLEWSETEGYQDRIASAQSNISLLFSGHSKGYVAYSGGKDSSMLLHLVLRDYPSTMTLHIDYGPYYIPREYYNNMIDNARKIGSTDIRIETSPQYRRLKRTAKGILGKTLFGRVEPGLVREGYDLCLVGIRSQESCIRKSRTQNRLLDKPGLIDVGFPIKDLLWQDVWAYIVSNRLPYLSQYYDKYAELVGYNAVRLVTLFDPEFDHLGNNNLDSVLVPEFKNVS